MRVLRRRIHWQRSEGGRPSIVGANGILTKILEMREDMDFDLCAWAMK